MKEKVFSLLALVTVFLSSSAVAAPPYEPGIILETPVTTEDATCSGYYQDLETQTGKVKFNWTVGTNQIKYENFTGVQPGNTKESSLDQSFYSYDDYLVCEVIVENSGGKENALADTRVESATPEIQDIRFQNYTSSHAFNVSAVIKDVEGADKINSCSLEASNGPSQISSSMNIDRNYRASTQALCTYSSISESDFPVLDRVSVEIQAEDHVGNVGNRTEANYVPNNPPEIFNIRPESGTDTSGNEVNLQANFLDRDGDQIQVEFYSQQASPNTICTDTLYTGNIECQWSGLTSIEDYQWRINASDGYQTTSRVFNFRNIKTSNFEVLTDIRQRYSSIIVSVDSSRSTSYTVKNQRSETKELTSEVTGMNAVFSRTGTDSIDYTVAPESSKTFNVLLEPSSSGRKDLIITTENREFQIMQEDSLEVFVRNADRSVPELPGIGLLHLILLALSASAYYSVRP